MLRLCNLSKRLNHFSLLKLDRQFNIDEKLLKRNFLQLQRENHPDKSSFSYPRCTLSSAEINKAYNCLKSPINRGLYLIKLSDASKNLSELKTISDGDFLLNIYEFNEEFDEAIERRDTVRFKELIGLNERKRESLIEEIDGKFKDGNLEGAFEKLAELKYYESIKERAFEVDL